MVKDTLLVSIRSVKIHFAILQTVVCSDIFVFNKSDIKTFGFCDIIFVYFLTAEPYIVRFTAYRIKDISLGQSTNIASKVFLEHFATETGR